MYGHFGFELLGTCASDVKIDKLANGTSRAVVNIVVNTPEKKDDGKYEERATWLTIALFGDRATRQTTQRLLKGTAVFVAGTVVSYQREIDGKKYTLHNFRPDVVRPIDSAPRNRSEDDGPDDYDGPETR